VANIRADTSVREEDKKTIMSYIKYREAQGLSIPRQVRYVFTLRKLSTLLEINRFKDATKNDLVNVISEIEREDTSYETKRTEKECIKCFYRWIRGGEEGEDYPLEVRWIKSKRARSKKFLPENLLTEDEVKRILP
jgi:site-specific recombinase XerD